MAEPTPDRWQEQLADRMRKHYATPEARMVQAQRTRQSLDLAAQLTAQLTALRQHLDDANRYERESMIDRGGMGQVWLARDPVLQRAVAVKLAATGEQQDHQQARLLAESTLIGRLQHPGIVPVHDVGVDQHGAPFFVMSHISGTTFADKLQLPCEQWSLAQRVEVLRRVCETMAYAHSCDLVHRDLKPANIMLGSFGEVYVVDWGLARSISGPLDTDASEDKIAASPQPAALTMMGSVLGTPAYLAPERAAGEAHDPRVARQGDIYALGAMLYEILTGKPAYVGERDRWSVTEILDTIQKRSPTPIHELALEADPELAAISTRAMQRSPERRYQSMQELQTDLRAWSEHRVVAAHATGSWRRFTKWLHRNRALSYTIGAAVVMLLVSTTWFVLRLSAARDQALASAHTASESLQDLLDLAVVQRITALKQRCDQDLWPAVATRIPAMQSWLADADALQEQHQRLQQRLTTLPTPGTASSAEDMWQRRLLDEALTALREFFASQPSNALAPLTANVGSVRKRIDVAKRLSADSVATPAAQQLWRTAQQRASEHAPYAGLNLPALDGFLPIGTDPKTELLEFVHLHTGTAPSRDAAGELQCDATTGLVFVLVPGGGFWMGALPDGPENFDALAETINEGPVHRVMLSPFLVAKFEMTQSQWQRATGDNPSVHHATSEYVQTDRAARHPVESIDWHLARSVLAKLGLRLPTEAQWEYAARANTQTPWWCGKTVADLIVPPAGNLADTTSAEALGVQGWHPTPGLRDGYVMHAPVGSFAANAFGLHDTLGNVSEWCDDEYVSYEREPAAGDGHRPRTEHPTTVMYRGGAFDQPAQEARSSNRAGAPPTRRHFSMGIRPVRAL